ncbi:DUF4169 family protein [Devosia sp. YIM 151766]|uniref:DUF4169 family protein n=1 Tax=Devosia sp. YIM 151766 TaxID=3017325 RepID=UPI00255C685B|nr:DUF4169 family protein [Devosia sp. YIM 151766]WIY54375.1 DUF4169 family protein [Devosia sp. YIM 151766]
MAEIVNLRNFRKQKARAEKAAGAEANRLKFGRSKAEKQNEALEKARADQHIEGHKREE